MSNALRAEAPAAETILVVDADVLQRAALAEYLRHCGYHVIEAASGKEALKLLKEPSVEVGIVFSVVEGLRSQETFELARWVRANLPQTDMILNSDIVKAADKAGDLCEEGPHLKKPYEPQALVDWIKRLRAAKPR